MKSQHKNAKVLECFAFSNTLVPRSYNSIIKVRATVAASRAGETECYKILDLTKIDKILRSGVNVRYMQMGHPVHRDACNTLREKLCEA